MTYKLTQIEDGSQGEEEDQFGVHVASLITKCQDPNGMWCYNGDHQSTELVSTGAKKEKWIQLHLPTKYIKHRLGLNAGHLAFTMHYIMIKEKLILTFLSIYKA